MTTITRFVTIESESCGACGTVFGLESHYMRERRATGEWFYCPNGHGISYVESEVQKLRRSLEQAQLAAISARELRDAEQRRREEAERSAAAHRGVATRMKRRAVNGVCVLGCKRTFADIKRHNEAKHPGAMST